MPEILRRGDLHLHTRFSVWKRLRCIRAHDSYADPEQVYDSARRAGMDYVAITDHESITGALRLIDRRPEAAPRIIVGEEVETRFPDTGPWLHVNVFGIDENDHREIQRLRGNVHELVGWLRGRGRLFVLNHPFMSFRFQRPAAAFAEEVIALFDHFEAGNSALPGVHHEAAEALLRHAARHGLRKVAVAGSDAHVPEDAGSSFTVAPGETTAEWLASIARGHCAYVTRALGFPRLLARVYRAVGCYYAGLLRAGNRRAMTPAGWIVAAGLLPGAALGVPAGLAFLNEARQRAVGRLVRRRLDAGPAVRGPIDLVAPALSTGTGAAPPAASSGKPGWP